MKFKKSLAISLFLIIGLCITVLGTVLLFNVTDYGIAIASFGATIFMIISRKKIDKRKIFGAYLVGISVGFIFSKLSVVFLNAALAAVISVILMTILELQHAPAIGISIAMVLREFSFSTVIIILLCIFGIFGIALMTKLFLKDPQKVLNFVEIEDEKIRWNF